MLVGDIDTRLAIRRDYTEITAGFEKLDEATDTLPKNLIRMFGPHANPQACNNRLYAEARRSCNCM